jgi:protein involved in polysaccharide export with SLBB domain
VVALVLGVSGVATAQGLPGSNLDARPDSAARARLPESAPGSVLEGPIDPAEYVLGPGDGLMLEVLGRVSMSLPLEVDPEGNIWIPDLGSQHLAGRTLAQAREQVRRSFKSGSRGLEVQLRLVRLRRILVYVSGEVLAPGAIQATAVTRLSEAIRLAGGFTSRAFPAQHRADQQRRQFAHRRPPALRAARGTRREPAAARGGPRDCSHRAHAVYLYAPVPYPGGYEFRPGETLTQLVAVGGGLLPTAMPERGRVLRFRDATHSDTLDVNVARALQGEGDLTLYEGDRIFIPGTTEYHEDRSVIVRGEVIRPGSYPIQEGVSRVSDALDQAGGITPEASRSGILVVRRKSNALERDLEFDRLSRLSRSDMTDAEYQTFRTKLAFAQTTFRVDFEPPPPGGPSPESRRGCSRATSRSRAATSSSSSAGSSPCRSRARSAGRGSWSSTPFAPASSTSRWRAGTARRRTRARSA